MIVLEDDMNDTKNPYPNGPRKGQFHVICTRMDEKRPRENGESCRYVAAINRKRARSQTIIFTKNICGLINIVRGDSGGFLGTHPRHPRQYGVISYGKVTQDNIVIGLA